MRRILLVFPILLVYPLVACSSDPAASGSADSGTDASGSGTPDAPLTSGGQSFRVDWGPISVGAANEETRCVEKKLGNTAAAWIGAIATELTASHHMIVYRVPGTQERPDPYPCRPFLDTLLPDSSGAPLMVTQIEQERLELPPGVAFGVEADQLVRLELHYVNYTDMPMTVQASATFETLAPEHFQNEADFLFSGNPDIQLAPGPGELGPTWFPVPPELHGVKVFGMTGHTHQWGTDVEVEFRPSRDVPGVMVYDYETWSWQEPPVARFDPPVEVTPGAGFRFTCRWNNQSGAPVGFGEGADDEMCFFWSYYYPSQGHKLCLHSDQFDDGAGEPGIDLCCPGHPLCTLVENFLSQ